MYNTSFIKKFLLAVTAVLLYSCDKDFNAIGEDLISDNHFDLVPENYNVVAFNQEVTPVQSNGLPLYGLGIFNNPVFGETTANFVAQVGLATYAPTIGDFTVVKSVVLTVPYASHQTAVDANGGYTYVLDSIYGNKVGGKVIDTRLKLSIYESGIQMYGSSFENGSQVAQLYYTDQDSNTSSGEINFDAKKIGNPLNNDEDKNQNENFFFDPKQITTVTKDAANVETKTYSAPQMRLNLNKQYFIDKILKAPAAKLASSTAFQEYFRGIYFKVEKSGTSPASMALLDFYKATDPAKITINYRAKTAITTDNDTITEAKTLVINLSGNSANLLQDAKSAAYSSAINSANINKTVGDDRLYLKGGQGSLAVVNLFASADLYSYNDAGEKKDGANGVPDQLDDIRNNVKTKHWLVNEANLVFYVDGEKMGTTQQPKRLYLYDLTNNTIIADYVDGTPTLTTDPKATRTVFGGILNTDATKGNSYKIRVTKHIRNLLKDETGTVKNVQLGLSVTEGIDVITMNKLKLKNDVFSQVPAGSVMGPLGTILFGGTANVPADKKLKLEVYYTKPN